MQTAQMDNVTWRKKLQKLIILPALVAATFASLPAAATNAGNVRILVHPNILVTHDPAASRNEAWLAADPRNPQRLVGAVTTMRDNDLQNSRYDTIHASIDGGNTWF